MRLRNPKAAADVVAAVVAAVALVVDVPVAAHPLAANPAVVVTDVGVANLVANKPPKAAFEKQSSFNAH